MFSRRVALLTLILKVWLTPSIAFVPTITPGKTLPSRASPTVTPTATKSTQLLAVVQDLDVVSLVAGQENYGLAVVCLGEAIWSLVSAPFSVSNAARVLVPAVLAAAVLVVVSGPMITSGVVDSVGMGLWIACVVSIGLGASYGLRLAAPYSASPKEIAALGLLVAVAGFFSFAQNLIVDGFVTLPSLPELPALPSIDLEL